MQALSKSNYDVMFDYINILIKNINYLLQTNLQFKKEEQQLKHDAFNVFKNDDYIKQDFEDTDILEKQVAEAITENK